VECKIVGRDFDFYHNGSYDWAENLTFFDQSQPTSVDCYIVKTEIIPSCPTIVGCPTLILGKFEDSTSKFGNIMRYFSLGWDVYKEYKSYCIPDFKQCSTSAKSCATISEELWVRPIDRYLFFSDFTIGGKQLIFNDVYYQTMGAVYTRNVTFRGLISTFCLRHSRWLTVENRYFDENGNVCYDRCVGCHCNLMSVSEDEAFEMLLSVNSRDHLINTTNAAFQFVHTINATHDFNFATHSYLQSSSRLVTDCRSVLNDSKSIGEKMVDSLISRLLGLLWDWYSRLWSFYFDALTYSIERSSDTLTALFGFIESKITSLFLILLNYIFTSEAPGLNLLTLIFWTWFYLKFQSLTFSVVTTVGVRTLTAVLLNTITHYV
jgi:hypothetical protein